MIGLSFYIEEKFIKGEVFVQQWIFPVDDDDEVISAAYACMPMVVLITYIRQGCPFALHVINGKMRRHS